MELYIQSVYICTMSKHNDTIEDKCVLCKGTGKYSLPKQIKYNEIEVKKHLAIKLSQEGYGLRQIQRILGYKSPRSIFVILQKHKNKE